MNNALASQPPPAQSVTVRIFEPHLRDAVGRLILSIQRDEFQVQITLEQQPDLTDIPSYYQKGKGNFWTAMAGERVVGTIGLLEIGNDQVALRKMFVAPDFRGGETRTAHQLLDTVLSWCHTQGVKQIFLGTTSKFIAAHRFYEKRGFIEIADTVLPPSFPRMVVDSKFYTMQLKGAA
jgi:N-acetylglutamate synthase-like GNAT family acetyltransferase